MPAQHLAGAAGARRLATQILRESRFHQPAVPRPLHSFLHALGSLLSAPARLVQDVATALGLALPGGEVTAWILLAVLFVAIVAVIARRYSRAALEGGPRSHADARGELRAHELERLAETAEREGRFAEAVRLRFRAGLQRLNEQGTIVTAGSTPTVEISRRLQSADFAQLARRFDEIAYGSAPAAAGDAEQAKQGWQQVVKAAKR